MPRVSVIIPMYGCADYIEETLQSVMDQSMTDWECIVVDDGSPDEAFAVAQAYARHDPRFQFIRQPNGGVSRARNRGADLAQAPYLFFLDADDLLERKALLAMSTYLEAHPKVGLVACQFCRIDADGNPTHVKRGMNHRTRMAPGPWGLPRDLPASQFQTPFVTFFCGSGQGANALYRRSVFEAVGRYDESFRSIHEDTDLFRRMALAAEVHYLPDVLQQYRYHPEAATQSYERGIRAAAQLRAKWDQYTPSTPEQQATLDAARSYYERVHRPLVHFKVSILAAFECVEERSVEKARWSVRNFRLGLRLLLFGPAPQSDAST
ncbi:MAG: glycosyltransferase family 2 protein [Bacteroidota bacterium]